MIRTLLCAAAAATLATAARAAEPPPLCAALHGLADAALQSGQPQRISVGAGPLNCRAGSAAGQAFCGAAAGGDADAFPWQVRACVETMSADPQITFGGAKAGLPHDKLITHLAAKLGHGVRMDLTTAAGGYDLVVWRPR